MSDLIVVEYDKFLKTFPYFLMKETSEESVQMAYESSLAYVPNEYGALGLSKAGQIRAVYLATAHILWLGYNPDKATSGNISSASEGSVSASMQLYDDAWKRFFQMSPYGMELLALLQKIQPPMPRTNYEISPYYNMFGNFNGRRI